MVQLIIGATNPNARELLAKIFRQRYEVFVKEKGWDLKTYNGLEFDNYDVPATLYLAQLDADGEMIASMRMNATDGPFLLKDVFPDMCHGAIPQGRDVWELTRGALSPKLRRSKHYGRMICGVLEAALLWGAQKSIGIYSVDYLMKQMQFGLDLKPLGPPRIMDGEPNVAAEFPFNFETLQRVRTSFGITEPVIERIYHMPQEGRAAA